MYELNLEAQFCAAHNLREYHGKCEKLHGHNWKVTVVFRCPELDKLGMVMDFRDAKQLVEGLLDELDHTYLNDHPYFKKENPTTENLSWYLYGKIAENLPELVKVYKVTVCQGFLFQLLGEVQQGVGYLQFGQ